MKLFSSSSNKGKGRQAPVNSEQRRPNDSQYAQRPQNGQYAQRPQGGQRTPQNGQGVRRTPVNGSQPIRPTGRRAKPKKMSTKKKVLIIVSSVLLIALLFGISAFAVVRWQIQPFFDYFFRPDPGDLATLPAVAATPRPPFNPDAVPGDDDYIDPDDYYNDLPHIELSPRIRNNQNFLLLGVDEVGNTDVIMLASLDLDDLTMDVVSIPRDTLVNVEWSIKKANSIYAYMLNRNRNDENRSQKAIQATKEYFSDIIGFEPDHVITIRMNAFINIINTVGPIPFNVPAAIAEEVFSGTGEVVRLERGQQNINGRQALALMRSRRNYSNHAIGRDYAQQEFLKAVATTVLATNWSPTKIADMAGTFYRNVTTDISLNHLAGFAADFMKLKANNINFHMMPGAIDSVGVQSYITIRVDPWLELINKHFNPFDRDITDRDVSIFTRGADGRLMVTDGNWQANPSWGSSSTGSRNPSLTTDSSRPIPGAPPREHLPEADTDGDRNPATGGTTDEGAADAPGGGETTDTGDDGGTGDGGDD